MSTTINLPSVLPSTQTSPGTVKDAANVLRYDSSSSADRKLWSVSAEGMANLQRQVDFIMNALRSAVGSLTPAGSSFTITTSGAQGVTLASVSASEVSQTNLNNQLFSNINILVTATSSVPLVYTIWIDFGDGNGYQWEGVFSSPSFQLSVPASLNPAQTTWKIAAIGGIYGSAGSPPAGFLSATFTVTSAQPCPATDITNITLQTNPATSDVFSYYRTDPGTYRWDLFELDWTQPTASQDSSYWLSFFSVQKGATSTGTGTVTSGKNLQSTAGATFTSAMVGYEVHVGGVLAFIATFTDATHVVLDRNVTNGSGQTYEIWTPAPDFEGINEDPSLAYLGRKISESRSLGGSMATTIKYRGQAPGNWGDPPANDTTGAANIYRKYRVRMYAVSVLGQNGTTPQPTTSVFTLQTGWTSNADHLDITPNSQPPSLDLTRSLTATLGSTLATNLGLFGVAPSSLSDTQVTPGGISTPSLTTGEIAVGGGGSKPIRFRVYDNSGIGIAWIGDDTANSGFVGAWFKQLRVGGSGPAGAPFVANSSGTLTIDGSAIINTITTVTLTASTITASSLTLNLNGVTTTIDNVAAGADQAGIKVVDNTNSWFSVVTQRGFVWFDAGSVARASLTQNGNGGTLNLSDSSGRAFAVSLSASPTRIIIDGTGGFSGTVTPVNSITVKGGVVTSVT